MPDSFFVWVGGRGLLKGKVSKKYTPAQSNNSKDAIHQEIQAVNVDTLGKVFQNL